MITELEAKDLKALSELIVVTIESCIDTDSKSVQMLIADSISSSEWWLQNKDKGVHLVYKLDNEILGTVLIKEFWNMASLFVSPSAQGRGIATDLVKAALKVCESKTPIDKVRLNSSSYASGFYQKFGFVSAGEPKDRPGGCIPYEYKFVP